MKPLLTLCMMVKDEAHTIARTLQSAKPYVDRWCILDTGSTDGTQGIIEAEMADVAGWLYLGTFVDFATSRNRLLQHALAEDVASEFLLLLDADDILDGGEALRAFLASPAMRERPASVSMPGKQAGPWPSDREAFYLTMRQGSCAWPSARVVRADAGWRYVGAVHEVLCHPERPAPSITIPGVTIRHEPPPRSAERSRARWERDLELLRPAAEKGDPRAAYYLALTLKRLGARAAAILAFTRRLDLGGFWQERYDSAFERALLLNGPGESLAFTGSMLLAHSIDPRRAEPLVALAEHYLTCDPPGFGPAFTFAKRAFELMSFPPRDALFLHADVYEWRVASVLAWAAFYVGEYALGEHAAVIALQRGPEHLREHHMRNLRFYTERKR